MSQVAPNVEEWVVLELGPKADGEDPDTVRASIRHSIRDAEVFIPASVTQIGEDKVVQYLVEGYAFVRRSHPDQTYYRLENTKYVQGVLRTSVNVKGGRPIRKLATISNTEIEKFRVQIHAQVDQGIGVGDMVMITSGPYRQITARVEEEIPEVDAVQVYIKLRSKEAIITLPRGCLRLVSKAPRSPLLDRAHALRDWLRGVRVTLGWPKDSILRVFLPYETFLRLEDWTQQGRSRFAFIRSFDTRLDYGPIEERYSGFDRLNMWVERGRPLFQAVRGLTVPLDFSVVRAKGEEVEKLARWTKRGKTLYGFVRTAYNPLPSSTLESKYLEWQWFQDVFNRLDTLGAEVASIERSLRSKGKEMKIENVVVDGTQLAIRCCSAPGLDTLTDTQGRPTGAIVGFLKSLGSFRKKFPGAALHVTWDGSSQRRRAQFEGYKANRSTRQPLSFEIEWLREVLPLLGVHQAWNPDEEADDVMATLVRGSLKGKANVIITTDRDMLQLVTKTDRQFVPAVGSGKEHYYDVDAVREEYGVVPDEVPVVRALSGDTSDTIPGAPGFGLKTASKLVKLYGSIDRIFASNLAGLTKTQYGNLRASEKQVRLNVELMRLHCDLPLTLIGSSPDQIAAASRLRDVDIQPDPILAALFAERVSES